MPRQYLVQVIGEGAWLTAKVPGGVPDAETAESLAAELWHTGSYPGVRVLEGALDPDTEKVVYAVRVQHGAASPEELHESPPVAATTAESSAEAPAPPPARKPSFHGSKSQRTWIAIAATSLVGLLSISVFLMLAEEPLPPPVEIAAPPPLAAPVTPEGEDAGPRTLKDFEPPSSPALPSLAEREGAVVGDGGGGVIPRSPNLSTPSTGGFVGTEEPQDALPPVQGRTEVATIDSRLVPEPGTPEADGGIPRPPPPIAAEPESEADLSPVVGTPVSDAPPPPALKPGSGTKVAALGAGTVDRPLPRLKPRRSAEICRRLLRSRPRPPSSRRSSTALRSRRFRCPTA